MNVPTQNKFSFYEYNQAKEYLIEIDRYDQFTKYSFSTDGYSLVTYANECWERQNAKP
jgi:hypothetical protein